jgi:hypothetical protein
MTSQRLRERYEVRRRPRRDQQTAIRVICDRQRAPPPTSTRQDQSLTSPDQCTSQDEPLRQASVEKRSELLWMLPAAPALRQHERHACWIGPVVGFRDPGLLAQPGLDRSRGCRFYASCDPGSELPPLVRSDSGLAGAAQPNNVQAPHRRNPAHGILHS